MHNRQTLRKLVLTLLCMAFFLPSACAENVYTCSVQADTTGLFSLRLTYKITQGTMQPAMVTVRINGEIQQASHERIILPALWQDETREYAVNEYGNDLYPKAVHVAAAQTCMLRESVYSADAPLQFELNAGVNTVEVVLHDTATEILQVEAVETNDPVAWDEYITADHAQGTAAHDVIVLEGEHYTYKSQASTRGQRSRSTQLHPYDAVHNRINALDGGTWAEPGNAVYWTFSVPEDGVYYLGLRYQQTARKDMKVYKTIKVDGMTVTEPLSAYGFDYTGSAVKGEVLNVNGEEIPFYLSKGEHTIAMISTAAPYQQIHQQLQQLTADMNELALDIKKISGNKVDKNRDWQLEYYLPDARSRLESIASNIDAIQGLMTEGNHGSAESTLSTLLVARRQIEQFLTDKDGMDELVNGLNSFAQASGSLAESIGLLAPAILNQALTIDRLYVLSTPEQLPDDGMNFLQSIWQEVRKTALSFFVKEDTAQTNKEDALNVWLIGSAQEMEILREMVALAYPERNVNISLATGEGKVQLAIAADNAPDVVIGGSMAFAYQLGIRDAVLDLSQFEDFEEIAERFYEESLVPATLNGQVYALPQTLESWLLFYRTDILESLGLTVPETWDDVIDMLPTLYRYGMDFNTVPAYGGALKNLTSLMPLMQQNGADLYAEDGMAVEFTSGAFIQGFTQLTDLYTKYGVSTAINNFYSSFRNGTVPIGISGLGTYVLLSEAATELDGLWGVALLPGVQTETGINRSHPAVNTGCMIIADTKRAEEAWEFVSWWMDVQVQNDFAQRLQTTYGSEYVWVSANRDALEMSSLFPTEVKTVILEQLACMQEIPSHPATTLVQRALSNAWNEVVLSGTDIRTALDSAQLEANRGIVRKLQQFGYIDGAGKTVVDLWEEKTP